MGDVICDYSQNLSNKPQTNQQLCALTLSQNTLTCPIVQTFTHSTVFSSSVFYCSHLFCSDVKFSPAEATSAKIFCNNLGEYWIVSWIWCSTKDIFTEKKKGDNKFSDGNRQGRSQNGRDLVFTLFKKWAGQTVTQKPWIHLINVLE